MTKHRTRPRAQVLEEVGPEFWATAGRVVRQTVKHESAKSGTNRVLAMEDDDLVQAILLAMWERRVWRRHRAARGSLERFLRVFARSRLIEFQRKQQRRSELGDSFHPTGDLDSALSDAPTPEHWVIARRSIEDLRREIRVRAGVHYCEWLDPLVLCPSDSTRWAQDNRVSPARASRFRSLVRSAYRDLHDCC